MFEDIISIIISQTYISKTVRHNMNILHQLTIITSTYRYYVNLALLRQLTIITST